MRIICIFLITRKSKRTLCYTVIIDTLIKKNTFIHTIKLLATSISVPPHWPYCGTVGPVDTVLVEFKRPDEKGQDNIVTEVVEVVDAFFDAVVDEVADAVFVEVVDEVVDEAVDEDVDAVVVEVVDTVVDEAVDEVVEEVFEVVDAVVVKVADEVVDAVVDAVVVEFVDAVHFHPDGHTGRHTE